jgi:hypothetical protein
MHLHLDHWRDGPPRAWEWGAIVASVSGGVSSVRETVHSLAGLWGDCAGALVSLLTIILLSFRLADGLKARKRRARKPKVESCPPPPLS